jgi:hypothetical protein
MSVIPATQEAVVGGSRFETGPGKVTMRPYLKNKYKKKRTKGIAQDSSDRALA